MAKKVGEAYVEVKAKIDKFLKDMDVAKKKLTGLGNIISKAKGLIAGFVGYEALRRIGGFIGKLTELSSIQETAEKKLITAMKSTRKYTEEGYKTLLNYASGLQKLTGYGDETVIEVMALLQTFKLSEDVLKKATLATLDLATATGQDLRSAAILMGKAAVGETGMLKRYGIIVDDAKLKAKGFEAVLEEINTEFGGQAQARMETYTGKVGGLKNAFGDLLEALGNVIIKSNAVRGAIDGLTESISATTERIKENKSLWEIIFGFGVSERGYYGIKYAPIHLYCKIFIRPD